MRWWRRMDIESKRLRYRCWFTFSSTCDLLLSFRCLPFYAQKCAAAPGPPPPRYERSTVKATFRLPPQTIMIRTKIKEENRFQCVGCHCIQ